MVDFGLVEGPPCVLLGEGVGLPGRIHSSADTGLTQAPGRKAVGVPVVVDVVLVFVGAGHTEDDPGLLGLGPIDALGPEPGDAEHDLPSPIGHVGRVTALADVVVDGVDHGAIPVNLLEGDLPLVVALLPVHGHHRVQCGAFGEAQLGRRFRWPGRGGCRR